MSENDPKLSRARELFERCDPEKGGYVTREGLSNLTTDLQLDSEQLDAVFTVLDQDGDEQLTFEEFLNGLGELQLSKIRALFYIFLAEEKYVLSNLFHILFVIHVPKLSKAALGCLSLDFQPIGRLCPSTHLSIIVRMIK